MSSEQLIISRVKSYLYENQELYIDITEMADTLQRKYRDYKGKKRGPFRALVRRAYDEITENLAKTQNSQDPWTDDNEIEIESDNQADTVPSEYLQCYKRKGPDHQNGNSSDKELIDISSDDDQDKNTSTVVNKSSDILSQGVQPAKKARLSPSISNASINNRLNVPWPDITIHKTTNVPPVKSNQSNQLNPWHQSSQSSHVSHASHASHSSHSNQVNEVNQFNQSNQQKHSNNSSQSHQSGKLKKKLKDKDIESTIQDVIISKKEKQATVPKVDFSDIGGNSKILENIVKLMIHVKQPETYAKLKITPPRGCLLHGPPGCGKSILVSAIAGEFNVPLLKVAAPELIRGISGESEQRIRELFEQAASIAPCILFFDEIDAIAPQRAVAQRAMESRIVTQLLACMDDLSPRVLVFGATNRLDAIDPALRRSGRFDKEISLGIPNKEAREAILKIHTSGVKISPKVSLKTLALLTPGFVGADLVAFIREAAVNCVYRMFYDLKREQNKDVPRPTPMQVEKDSDVDIADVIIDDDIIVEPTTSSSSSTRKADKLTASSSEKSKISDDSEQLNVSLKSVEELSPKPTPGTSAVEMESTVTESTPNTSLADNKPMEVTSISASETKATETLNTPDVETKSAEASTTSVAEIKSTETPKPSEEEIKTTDDPCSSVAEAKSSEGGISVAKTTITDVPSTSAAEIKKTEVTNTSAAETKKTEIASTSEIETKSTEGAITSVDENKSTEVASTSAAETIDIEAPSNSNAVIKSTEVAETQLTEIAETQYETANEIESNTMINEVEMRSPIEEPPLKIESPNKFKDILSWLRNDSLLTPEQLDLLTIEEQDFELALKDVQPSAKREGFATVPDVTWDDIGSLQHIREELQMAILAPVKLSDEFDNLGLEASTGVLLCGPPGCGKTLLAKAIANEAGINFISVKGPELLNMYVGESERAVRQCFLRARNSSPCVIFFDELDALCPKRSEGDNSASSRVVNQLLTEMDGVEGRKNVFILAASNRPDIIDPAVLRPGRLGKILYVGLPNPNDRVDILTALTKNGTKPKLAADVDLKALAERCAGYTGADLAAFVHEAGVEKVREIMRGAFGPTEVCARHFEAAFVKIKPSVTEKDIKHYEKLRLRYAAKTTDTTDVQMKLEIPEAEMEAMET
ncbi:hypothetical protein TKK_0001256 [Trichogramma kaykai]|uniref:AAA+ ATPase domain-containing protein n=1 Tax=Trichogramma kaykai TaxID=54128 RepID=A0ABD2WWC2_9HYME